MLDSHLQQVAPLSNLQHTRLAFMFVCAYVHELSTLSFVQKSCLHGGANKSG